MDFVGAALVRLFGQTPGSLEASVLVSLLPVLLGVAAVWMVVLLAREVLPAGASPYAPLACGAVMAMLPQAVATSRFGRVDHHIFEVLCMGFLGLWVLRSIGGVRGIRWEAAGALVLFGGLATFAGSVLYAGIAAGLLLLLRIQRPTRQPEPVIGSGAPAFAIAAAGSLLLYGEPVSASFSYVFPSYLQPALLLLAALVLWGAARGGLSGGSAASVLGLSCLFVFESPRQEFVAGFRGWLGREDPWLAAIAEFQPLLLAGPFSASSWEVVGRYFGLFGLLGPLLLVAGVWTVARTAPRKATAFACWTLVLVALALLQNRFGRIASINLALCAGMVAHRITQGLGDRRSTAAMFLVVGVLGLGSPAIRTQFVSPAARPLAAIEEAALFLRDAAPSTGHEEADAGVAAPWDFGHFLLWLGHRPVVSTGFGTYLDPIGFMETRDVQLGNEAQALAWLKRRQLGYLVAGAATFSGRVDGGSAGALLLPNSEGLAIVNPRFTQAFPMAVSLVGGSGFPTVGTPHFEELRPVFASSALVPRAAVPMPSLWVYQRVRPSVLEGFGQPGERVFARIDLDVRGRPWPWAAVTVVKQDGTWSLNVPLELGSLSGGIRTPEAFSVSVG